jgi:hypothetical protein
MVTESAIIHSSKFWGWEDIVPFSCSQTPVLYWWVVLHFMLSQPLRFEEVVVYTWAQDWHSYWTGMRFHHIHQLWWIGYSTHLYPAVLVTCAEKEICQFQVVGCIANYDDQIHHERKSVMVLHNVVQRRCHCIAVTEWWWMCHVLSQTALISLHRKVGSSDLKLGKLKFVLSDSVQNNHLPFVVGSCCPQWHLPQFFRREIKCY